MLVRAEILNFKRSRRNSHQNIRATGQQPQ